MIASKSLRCVVTNVIIILVELYLICPVLFDRLVLLKAILTLCILNEVINHNPFLIHGIIGSILIRLNDVLLKGELMVLMILLTPELVHGAKIFSQVSILLLRLIIPYLGRKHLFELKLVVYHIFGHVLNLSVRGVSLGFFVETQP